MTKPKNKLKKFISKLWPSKTPKAKDNLVWAFNYEGHDYYQWPDELVRTMERTAQSVLFSVELAMGIDTKKYEELLTLTERNIMEGVGKPDKLVRAIGYIHEIKLRKSQISPLNLYYQQFAVNYIRDDEDPMIFNFQIQAEKVEVFARAAQDGQSFFFALPEYKGLCKRLNIFSENWKDVTTLSLQAQRRNEAAEDLLRQSK